MKTNAQVRNPHQQQLVDSMRGWIKAKNAVRCQDFAEEIGHSKDADGLPALMELLRLPLGLWHRRPTAAMCEAREAAVRAIAKIDSPDALSSVGIALFNPCAEVRAAASEVLHQAGDKASEPLARMMHWKQNWSVEGMRVLLYTLGTTRNPKAGPPLARVVLGELPIAPPRWRSKVVYSILPLAVIEFLFVMWILAISTAALGLSLFLFFGMLSFFGIIDFMLGVAILNSISTKERRSLAVAGCEALWMLGDKKALGTLLFNSQRPESDIAAAAYKGVLALLPTLNEQDTEWMPFAVRQRLTAMLGLSDPSMVLAILRAMEFVGTGQAEQPIYRLMTKSPLPEIREEAARIYPIIVERAKQEKVSGTLLRASQSPNHAKGELLRAAYASSETASEELLRPTLGQSE